MPLRNQVQLITYPHRLGGNLAALGDILDAHLEKAIGGLHILPLYPSNADGGFSPLTHKEVDAAYGTWADVERISGKYDLCLDLTINHISDASVEFQDFLTKGFKSEYADLFVHVDQLGEITPDDLAKIHIRKEKEPFREVRLPDGSVDRVWTTFTDRQIDLNYNSPRTYALMEEYVKFLTARGVKLFRLDAFGYTTKRLGTSCFLVEPDVYEICHWVQKLALEHGAETLPEVHDHPSFQYAIELHGMRSYGFALPPLVLHALLDADARYLKRYLRMCPRTQVTVLDTHDGICIPDVEGFLPQQQIQDLIDNVSTRSADPILRRSAANVHSVGAIYQLTCTFFDALKQNEDANVAARAIQFFAPGIPQIYYVGWLGGTNEVERAEDTGDPREINRHYYTREDVDAAMKEPMVRRLTRLMEFRSTYPAFQGTFHLQYSNDKSLSLAWRKDEYRCELFVVCVPPAPGMKVYDEIQATIAQRAGALNGRFSTLDYVPLVLFAQPLGFDELMAWYRAADICWITPLRDGLNLVAKEFIAAKEGNDGKLVLSEFTGAAVELEQAILMHPYSARSMDRAIDEALDMPHDEEYERMQRLFAATKHHDLAWWIDEMLKRFGVEPVAKGGAA